MTPDQILAERGLPWSQDAERTLLGMILLEGDRFDEVELSSRDFFLDSHMRIFAAMAALREENHEIDIVTLAEELRTQCALDSIGGVSYLASLSEGLPRRLSVDEYVRIVRDFAKRRRVINELQLTLVNALSHDLDADELIADHDKRLLDLTSSGDGDTSATLATICDCEFPALLEERNHREPQHVVPTGLDILDGPLGGGWLKGELGIIAGRPGDGKSSLLTQTGVACGRNNIPALIFQLEMDRAQVLRRFLSGMTNIRYSRLRQPYYLTEADMRRIDQARDELRHFPVRIEFCRRPTASQLVSRARIAKRRYGIQFVGLDYLQRLRFSTEKPEARYIAVGDATIALSDLAKDEHLAVVAVSSLTEKRGKDAKPSMADLRQSGEIQYEAGSIILLYPKETVQKDGIKWTGEIILDKQRQGETGPIDVKYTDSLQFESTEPKPSPQQDLPLGREPAS